MSLRRVYSWDVFYPYFIYSVVHCCRTILDVGVYDNHVYPKPSRFPPITMPFSSVYHNQASGFYIRCASVPFSRKSQQHRNIQAYEMPIRIQIAEQTVRACGVDLPGRTHVIGRTRLHSWGRVIVVARTSDRYPLRYDRRTSCLSSFSDGAGRGRKPTPTRLLYPAFLAPVAITWTNPPTKNAIVPLSYNCGQFTRVCS